jgi:hypothetical protein
MVEAGVPDRQVMAHSGHESVKELLRYTKKADQARLARIAMKTLMGAPRTKDESKVSGTETKVSGNV